MKKTSNKSAYNLAAIIIVAIIILGTAILSNSLTFQQNPEILPATAYTTNNLTCSWQVSSDTTQVNISWYADGVLFFNETATGNISIISNDSTIKNQIWKCNVTATNTTHTISYETETTIINKAPDEPTVYNNTHNIGSSMMLYEDITYMFDINSTDADLDILEYRISPTNSFCTTTDGTTGAVSCTPTHLNLALNGSSESMGQKNITFWADDTDPFYPKSTGHTTLFSITPVNDAPELTSPLTTQNTSEGSTFNYHISATDEENNLPIIYTILINSTLNLIINQTSNTTATIMFQNNGTATYQEAGNYTVNVTMNDSMNASRTSSFILEIIPVNQAPVIRQPSLFNATQGQSFSALFYADDTDANESNMNFSIESSTCIYGNIWSITTNITNKIGNTNATGNITIANLTNEYVVCRNITLIVVDDTGAPDSEDVFLNITNTNDPPIVQVLSSFSNNTAGQTNISNLTAYSNAAFTYAVNGTDVDQLTYEGDTLTYSDNSSLFNINPNTGAITFTASDSDIGTHNINITVTDIDGATHSRTMVLTVINNSIPTLTPIGNITCLEDQECSFTINATDIDNDNITFTSNNSIFNITSNYSINPVNSSYLNFTPTQAQIGNYSVRVTATDENGAYDYEDIIFRIVNSNDAPVIVNFTVPLTVETHPVGFNIYATDEDYNLANPTEQINFSVINTSGRSIVNITTLINASNQTYARVAFVPQIGDAGTYSFNITATDSSNATYTLSKTFTILAKSNPPNITHVKPYLNSSSGAPIQNYAVNNYTNNQMAFTINENTTLLFDINTTDETAEENMTYSWTLDGTTVASTKSITRTFDFFSSGLDQYIITAFDTMLENATFTWNITVNNINRQPNLLTNISNIQVNGTTIFTDYLISPTAKFLDPDDDLDSDNTLDGSEISTLNYNTTSCAVAEIVITNQTLRIEPVQIGSCNLTITAMDSGGLTRTSNTFTINASQITNDTTVIETPISSSGGGGNARRSPIPIPITKQDLKPQAIEIIVPEIVTVYENNTVVVPVTIQNTWNISLKQIKINVTSESEDLKFELTENYFEELTKGEKRNISLYISNYRMGEDYKVQIYANVSDPKTQDSAYIFLNTIEQSEAGKDVQTKVTFAQDLLNENPECLELNELLQKAKEQLDTGGNVAEASHIVDGVIEGCKYLVSLSKKSTQQPQTIIQKVLNKEYRIYLIAFISACLIITAAVSFAKRRKISNAKKEVDEKNKSEEDQGTKPYWPTQ